MPSWRASSRVPLALRVARSTSAFTSVSIFELARLMGTSVKVIDSTYGHLVRDSFDRVRTALEQRARREARHVRKQEA
jgi:hypothetical protein